MPDQPVSTAGPAHGQERRGLRPVTPVGIAAARLAVLTEALDAAGVPAALVDEARKVHALLDGLEPYLQRCTTPPSAALVELARRTEAADWAALTGPDDSTGEASRPPVEAEMLSGHVEGQLLAMLVRMTGARRVLEVGLFTGYSALAMAQALPGDGHLVACEIDPDVARFARKCLDDAASGEKVEIRVGPAADTLRDLAQAGRPFDLVFIDADKPGYAGYLDQILDGGLLAEGGTVLLDNTLLQGEPYAATEPSANGAAIAAFNARVADDPRLEQVVLPLRDGLSVIRRA